MPGEENKNYGRETACDMTLEVKVRSVRVFGWFFTSGVSHGLYKVPWSLYSLQVKVNTEMSLEKAEEPMCIYKEVMSSADDIEGVPAYHQVF